MPTPLDTFNENMSDAEFLVNLASLLENRRARRMRRELREGIGGVLRLTAKETEQLDCVESDGFFVVLKPGSALKREDLQDSRPLLRQALVAACAAVETYMFDKAMDQIGPLIRYPDRTTDRLKKLTMTLEDWQRIEHNYERRRRGLREVVVKREIAQLASTSPTKVGHILSLVGVRNWATEVDKKRGVRRGDTVAVLDRITVRRNRIAHTADRAGRGRAHLTVDEVRQDLLALKSFVAAVEDILG